MVIPTSVISPFQFTHPGKGATSLSVLSTMALLVSIHAPWEGCDCAQARSARAESEVSIHAPWEGCDSNETIPKVGHWGFNSRTLGRVRQELLALSTISRVFQFTHPGKGATTRSLRAMFAIEFQFTHPGKGATESNGVSENELTVSIHAPWEGCDSRGHPPRPTHESFNSRTLGRVRLRLLSLKSPHKKFQFTHPGKGATLSLRRSLRRCRRFNSRTLGRVRQLVLLADNWVSHVSIHAPWEGCDEGAVSLELKLVKFQFTHPGKGATTGSVDPLPRLPSFNSRTLGRVRRSVTVLK